MKLYTEEQLKEFFKEHYFFMERDLDNLTPIELPSDDAIEAAAVDTYREHPNNPKEHPEWTYNKDVNAPRKRRAFNIGAHWVLNHINQQKDIDVPLSKQ
jgi:hypothetical protein